MKIYTHNIAARIVDSFEYLLEKNNIKIPDEDRRGREDEACLYGMTYGNLLDEVEDEVVKACKQVEKGADIIVGFFE